MTQEDPATVAVIAAGAAIAASGLCVFVSLMLAMERWVVWASRLLAAGWVGMVAFYAIRILPPWLERTP